MGANAEDVAKVAVGGAIEAAGAIGSTALRAVREMLVGVAAGVRDVAEAAIPTRSPAAAEPAREETATEPEGEPGPDKMGDRRRRPKE